LVFRDESLFDDQIEAWVHGPVVPAIFRRYREYRWNPILRLPGIPMSIPLRKHLEEVWRVYGKFDATTLERLTHSERPWARARAGLPVDVPSHNVISNRSMKAYYSSLLNG
jgi:uncharacterized phage-associated protein